MRRVEDEHGLTEALHVPLGMLFKHSPACWGSARALRHVHRFMDRHPDVPVYLVDVLARRPLSEEVARRLCVQHESPQAILISEGSVVWEGSHGDVTADALSASLDMA